MENSKERGEYPKIEKYKQEKSKLLDLESTLRDLQRAGLSFQALAFRYTKYKTLAIKHNEVIVELRAEITKCKENLTKYGQPSKSTAETNARTDIP